MTRPAVGAALRRCAECGGYEYSGGAACSVCRELVDGIVESEWSAFLREWDADRDQEAALAAMVVSEPDRHDWRVVDAALDRLGCSSCGERLGRGPVGCSACDLAHGFRYAAIETDRPGVPPGNEHAVRVNVSVVRRPHATSDREALARRLMLPLVLIGFLPSTEEAQRLSALVKSSSPAEATRIVERAIEETVARGHVGVWGAPGKFISSGHG
ncbi:hypothetical protein [Streptomyces marincola]|uniref:hypothetical protein n=1 Tax=Streptomyces marincola TaxID=2878388 RepID=UPI001CF1E990|nr:hypothetical protein [Streptomyces marincola]UCM90587.1 hypothetical protein LC193_23080 [Streptomyces marincola]